MAISKTNLTAMSLLFFVLNFMLQWRLQRKMFRVSAAIEFMTVCKEIHMIMKKLQHYVRYRGLGYRNVSGITQNYAVTGSAHFMQYKVLAIVHTKLTLELR